MTDVEKLIAELKQQDFSWQSTDFMCGYLQACIDIQSNLRKPAEQAPDMEVRANDNKSNDPWAVGFRDVIPNHCPPLALDKAIEITRKHAEQVPDRITVVSTHCPCGNTIRVTDEQLTKEAL